MSQYHHTDFTFARIIASQAERRGDKTFLRFLPDGRTYTFAETHALSNGIANGFLERGVMQGQHVALLMNNSPEMVMAYFALGKIGAVSVPINTASRGAFLEYYINHSDASAVVIDHDLLPAFLALQDRGRVARIFVHGAEGAELPDDGIATITHYADLALGSPDDPGIEVSFKDLAAIMYTSGTTGASKGVMFTQIHALSWGLSVIEATRLTDDDVYHVCMPLFHAAALNAGVTKMLIVGGGVSLVRRLSASNFLKEAREGGATVTTLLGIADFLLDQPPSPDDRDNALRYIQVAPMPQRADEFEQRFGARLIQSYGLSDYALAFIQDVEDWPADKRRSIGKLLPGMAARIVDADDAPVPAGVVGEILLRKDGMPYASSSGYYKMPEATALAWRNLWFHTGDKGYRDEEGYFYHAGRKQDSLRRRGENISAYELENVIGKHPAIAEVAVYGVKIPGETEDEVAVAAVRIDGATIDEIALHDFCKENLPYFAVPRFIEFRRTLPRTATHKVSKPELVVAFGEGREKIWDAVQAGAARVTRRQQAPTQDRK